ncbi:MAG: hypothetical protein WAM78_14445 [Candidatus Sulfotelmatobacter sp.]
MALGNVRRCQHIKINGTQCGSPALNQKRQCFFHERARQQHNRILKDQFKHARFVMPVLEDANAVQMALMQVIQLLATGDVDRKVAGLMLYGLQTASANLRYVDFEVDEPTDVVIHRGDVVETDIGGPQWDPEDFEWDEEDEEDLETAEDEEEEEEEDSDEEESDQEDEEGGEVEDDEDDEEEDGDLVAASAGTEMGAKDPVVAALMARAERKAVPTMEEARKQVRAVVHDYIVETGRIPTKFSG